MNYRDRKPDSDALPLSEEELAAFNDLTDRIGPTQRFSLSARFRSSPSWPLRAGAIRLLLVLVLLLACTPLAVVNPFLGLLPFIAAVGLSLHSIHMWKQLVFYIKSELLRR